MSSVLSHHSTSTTTVNTNMSSVPIEPTKPQIAKSLQFGRVSSASLTSTQPKSAYIFSSDTMDGELAPGQSAFSSTLFGVDSPKESPNIPKSLRQQYEKDVIWTADSVETSFQIQECIGEGTYGSVHKAVMKKNPNVSAALKKFTIDSHLGFSVTTLREIQLLQSLKGENVVKVLNATASNPIPRTQNPMNLPRFSHATTYLPASAGAGTYVYTAAGTTVQSVDFKDTPPLVQDLKSVGAGETVLGMEYCITDLLKLSQIAHMPDDVIRYFIYNILIGLKECHDHDIMHRDIKPDNVLVDAQGGVKIADFGLARRTAPQTRYTGDVITMWYRAPEVFLMNSGASFPLRSSDLLNYDKKIDVWSVGCIFGHLLLGDVLFKQRTSAEMLSAIFAFCGSPDEKNWPSLSKYTLDGPIKLNDLPPPVNPVDETVLRRAGVTPVSMNFLKFLLILDPERRPTVENALRHDYFQSAPILSREEFMKKYGEDLFRLASAAKLRSQGTLTHVAPADVRKEHWRGSGTDTGHHRRPHEGNGDRDQISNKRQCIEETIDVEKLRIEVTTILPYLPQMMEDCPQGLDAATMNPEQLMYWRERYVYLYNQILQRNAAVESINIDYGMM